MPISPCLYSKTLASDRTIYKVNPRRGRDRTGLGLRTCMLLQADAVQCCAWSFTIYGPWTVYKKLCSQSERQASWGRAGVISMQEAVLWNNICHDKDVYLVTLNSRGAPPATYYFMKESLRAALFFCCCFFFPAILLWNVETVAVLFLLFQ